MFSPYVERLLCFLQVAGTLRVKLLVTYPPLTPRRPMGWSKNHTLIGRPILIWVQSPLAQSLKATVIAVQGRNTSPWLGVTHSLGGAILDFGVMDLFIQGTFVALTVVTIGSVAVGNNDWANAYNFRIPNAFCVANLCDFVPSIRNVLRSEPPVNLYTYIGQGICLSGKRMQIG